jgi:hypothetical protein
MGCMRNSSTICPVTKPSPVALFKGLGNHEIGFRHGSWDLQIGRTLLTQFTAGKSQVMARGHVFCAHVDGTDGPEEHNCSMKVARSKKYTMMEAFDLKTNSDLFRFAIKEGVIAAS